MDYTQIDEKQKKNSYTHSKVPANRRNKSNLKWSISKEKKKETEGREVNK